MPLTPSSSGRHDHSERARRTLNEDEMINEIFSDTIRRLAKRRDLVDCAGAWPDVPEEEMKAYEEGIREQRDKTQRSLEEKTLAFR